MIRKKRIKCACLLLSNFLESDIHDLSQAAASWFKSDVLYKNPSFYVYTTPFRVVTLILLVRIEKHPNCE